MCPVRIVSVGTKKAYQGATGTLNYELQAKPCVKDTWHELPTVDGSEEGKVSNWSIRADKDGFPKYMPLGSTNVVPKDLSSGKAKEMLPSGIKVSFAKEDKEYENFLASPPLVKSNEMFIEGPFMRGPANVKVKTDKNVVKIEKFARDGIRESHGVICMLEMLSDKLKESLAEGAGSWDPVAMLRLTHEWLDLVLLTAFRSGAFMQSVHVLAKDSLRDEALDCLYGKPETKKNLLYSHYATPNVFGPLSADFEPYVLPTSNTHESYKLAPRYGSRGASSQDNVSWSGPSSSSGAGQNKRGANSHWGASKNKRGKHSDNVVKNISPQEILRKSRGNSGRGRQGQGFRGNWGKGGKSFRGANRR